MSCLHGCVILHLRHLYAQFTRRIALGLLTSHFSSLLGLTGLISPLYSLPGAYYSRERGLLRIFNRRDGSTYFASLLSHARRENCAFRARIRLSRSFLRRTRSVGFYSEKSGLKDARQRTVSENKRDFPFSRGVNDTGILRPL